MPSLRLGKWSRIVAICAIAIAIVAIAIVYAGSFSKYYTSIVEKKEILNIKPLNVDTRLIAKALGVGSVKILHVDFAGNKLGLLVEVLQNGKSRLYYVVYGSGKVLNIEPIVFDKASVKVVHEKIVNRNVGDSKEKLYKIVYLEYVRKSKPIKTVTGDTVCVVEYYYTLEGKDIFGIVLWELKVGGYYYVIVGKEVYNVLDNSEAWANTVLGWTVKSFTSWVTYGQNNVYGQVNEYAVFQGPFQTVHAYAWARVYKNLQTQGGEQTW